MKNHDSRAIPDYRATIGRGRLMLVCWHPQLVEVWAPCSAQLHACDRAGIAITDLTVIRKPGVPLELIVTFLSGAQRADVRDSILRWAALLAYRRVWLPPDVFVDLSDVYVPVGEVARTRCPTCRTRWEDGDPEFWLWVRRCGIFPTACRLCGGDLPQWEVVHAANEPRGGA